MTASAVPAAESPRPTSGAVTAPSANWVSPSSADAEPAIRRCRSIAMAEACGNANPTADTMTNSETSTIARPQPASTVDGQQRSHRPAPARRPSVSSTNEVVRRSRIRPIWVASTMPIAFSAKQALNHCADSPKPSCSRNGDAEM